MKTKLLNMMALIMAKAKGSNGLILLVSLYSLLLIPLHALALVTGDKFTKDGFTYVVKNDSLYLISVYGCSLSGEVTIPKTEEYEEKTWKVVEIAGEWNNPSWSQTITKVIVQEGVTAIGMHAFNGASLVSLSFPKGLSSIDKEGLIYLGNSITEITVDGNDDGIGDNFKAIKGVLYTNENELVRVPSNKSFDNNTFNVPEGVVTIWANAFAYNQQITTISLPQSCIKLENEYQHGIANSAIKLSEIIVHSENPVLSAENGVLYDNDKHMLVLYPPKKEGESFTVKDGITTIVSYGFFQNPYLQILDLNEVEKLEKRSIFQCSGLLTITIPASLKTIDAPAIIGCENITDYIVDENNDLYSSVDGVIYNKEKTKLLYFPAGKTGTYSFRDKGIESLQIIGKSSMESCKIGSLIIPSSVTTIEDSGLFNMGHLTSLTFEEGSQLKNIGPHGIYNIPSLKRLDLPASLEQIQYQGLAALGSLEEITFPENSQLKLIHQEAFLNDSLLKNVVFEGACSLEVIGERAFEGCKNLESFSVPASCQYIMNLAFGGCKSLSTITFTDDASITTLLEGALADCGLKEISLPSSLTTIEKEVFRKCEALEKVNVEANTTYISPEAFKYCENLTEINVVKENNTYSSWDGILLTKNKETLVIFPAGKGYENFTLLPPSLKTIGDYAFYDCKKLKNVVVPNKVNSIGRRAFGLCNNLESITFLCDEMIDPNNIDQTSNEMSFDDGTHDDTINMFGKITIRVRKKLLDNYKNSDFYKKFIKDEAGNGIEPSSIDNTSRVGGLNKSNATEEFIVVSDEEGARTVDLLSVVTNDETYVLPTSVTIGGNTYAVKLVGDYLFTATGSEIGQNVKEVVVPGEIEYIGARAFMKDASITSTSSPVENVFLIGKQPNEDLLSTARFELTAEDLGTSNDTIYDEFGKDTKIYVCKSADSTYKTAWPHYDKKISYKIPYTQSGTFGTFAREFDVDFSEVNGVNDENPVTDDPVLIAFTGDGKYNKNGNTFSVHMTSINLGDQTGKDGTYVPAGSGVLMKKYKKDTEDLYYQIAETGISDAFVDGNFMKGIIIRPETIGKGSDVNRYFISGGTLHEMTKDTDFNNHKSYMELPTGAVPNGAKVMLSFGDWDNDATVIDALATENSIVNGDVIYNLQGQRVEKATKGIYVKNGKKVYVK